MSTDNELDQLIERTAKLQEQIAAELNRLKEIKTAIDCARKLAEAYRQERQTR